MKKKLLFGFMAVLLAGLGFGGISRAAEITTEDFIKSDAGEGRYNFGWHYSDDFPADDITSIEVRMEDEEGNVILKYTADSTTVGVDAKYNPESLNQIDWQKSSSHNTYAPYNEAGKSASAPFYQVRGGSLTKDYDDVDWSVIVGTAFYEWSPATAHIKVIANGETYEAETEYQSDSFADHIEAIIGDKAYWTLGEAIADATDGDTIKLVHDVVLDENTQFSIYNKVTINGDNHQITANTSRDDFGGIFAFAGGSEGSTIENMIVNFKGTARDNSVIYFFEGFGSNEGTTTVENITVNGSNDQGIAILTPNPVEGTISITGNTFKDLKYGMYFNSLGNVSVTNNIIDGTKYNAIHIVNGESISISNNELSNISTEGYDDQGNGYAEGFFSAGISIEDISEITISDNNITMLNDKMPIYNAKWVAMIEDEGYATLKDAISAHEEGDAIKLIKDVIIDEDLQIDVAGALDLNGNDLTLSEDKILTLNANVTIEDTAETTGQLIVEGNIKVNGATLDISSLNFGMDGLVAGKPGSLIADENSTIKLMPSILTVYPVTAEDLLNSGNPKFIIGSVGTIVEINGERFKCTATRNTDDTCDIREVPSYTVTFNPNGATLADEQKTATVKYNETVAAPSVSLSCNRFDGWYNGNTKFNFTTLITSDLTLTAKWTYTCGGGGSSSSSSNKTPTTTGTVETGTVDTGADNNTTDNSRYEEGNQQEVLKNGFTREFNNAYNFAYLNGITTMRNISKADMNGNLNRIAMAKMLSQYAINVLGKTPDITKKCEFKDVTSKMDKDYNDGVTLACQLGIMGMNMGDNFRPNDIVTRAEFGTALSRMLFNLADGTDNYYSTHLAKLKKEKIISNDDPTLKELRGYVMLMLMRSGLNK